MPLDPQIEALLAQMVEQGARAPESMTVAENRAMIEEFAGLGGPPAQLARVEDTTAPGQEGDIPVRVYVPPGDGPLPVVVFYHGGGWVIGSLDSHDAVCRALAARSGCLVAAVDYRLAPEHRFPAAVDDAYAALTWAGEKIGGFGGDPGRLAVAGDSAGGNLAAVVSQLAKERGGPRVAFQLLIYPATDRFDDSPSMSENVAGPLLSRAWIEWFYGCYLHSPDQGADPRFSPGRHDDLGGLPPALLVTAEFDPLRDQGAAYVGKLRQAGVDAELLAVDGMIHGFISMIGVVDKARETLDRAGDALRAALA
ncbi:alpha/beta hydrolase [Actinomycetospora sp. NBRC 106375]|uniref:alpha/beta hydrolase n=1 Tax=Actinomycetospora sp. NBRC 106375 TaxID=3032207 RepID=UPI0024A282F0|nr:alpha/beta hydrolase [Actinomycetospora sp. NBRC 106375]GLZ48369.1 alpha/beta hydrolase [Actinomycetospora sp. NBRC 106375]